MAGPIVGIGELLWDLLPSGPRAGGAGPLTSLSIVNNSAIRPSSSAA